MVDTGLVTVLRATRLADGEPGDIRARRVGLGATVYYPIESGRTTPSAQAAAALERAFEVPIDELLKRVDRHRVTSLPRLMRPVERDR